MSRGLGDVYKRQRGLSVPGMPIGSPGMEMGTQKESFETLLVLNDWKTVVFNQHN